MARKTYHKIDAVGAIVDTVRVDETMAPKNVATSSFDGGPVWRVEERVVTDTSTGPDIVSSRGALVVEVTRVVLPITIRDKTAQELDDDKGDEVSVVQRVVFEALLDIVNDIRSRHGQGAITRAQYFTYLKGLLP